jgi:hypothetical protein
MRGGTPYDGRISVLARRYEDYNGEPVPPLIAEMSSDRGREPRPKMVNTAQPESPTPHRASEKAATVECGSNTP